MHLQDKKGEINLYYFLMRAFGIHRKPDKDIRRNCRLKCVYPQAGFTQLSSSSYILTSLGIYHITPCRWEWFSFFVVFLNNFGLFVKCSACAIGLNSVQSKKKVYRGKTFSHVYISLKTLNES